MSEDESKPHDEGSTPKPEPGKLVRAISHSATHCGHEHEKVFGKVKWFSKAKGYGFIIQHNETQDEIYVYWKDIVRPTDSGAWVSIPPGQEVSFVLGNFKDRSTATRVTLPDGSPIPFEKKRSKKKTNQGNNEATGSQDTRQQRPQGGRQQNNRQQGRNRQNQQRGPHQNQPRHHQYGTGRGRGNMRHGGQGRGGGQQHHMPQNHGRLNRGLSILRHRNTLELPAGLQDNDLVLDQPGLSPNARTFTPNPDPRQIHPQPRAHHQRQPPQRPPPKRPQHPAPGAAMTDQPRRRTSSVLNELWDDVGFDPNNPSQANSSASSKNASSHSSFDPTIADIAEDSPQQPSASSKRKKKRRSRRNRSGRTRSSSESSVERVDEQPAASEPLSRRKGPRDRRRSSV